MQCTTERDGLSLFAAGRGMNHLAIGLRLLDRLFKGLSFEVIIHWIVSFETSVYLVVILFEGGDD